MNTTSGRQNLGVRHRVAQKMKWGSMTAVRSAAWYMEGLKDERAVCSRSEPVADLSAYSELRVAPVNGAIDFELTAATANRHLAVRQDPNGGECSACYRVPCRPGHLAARSALIEQATAASRTSVVTCVAFNLTGDALRDVFETGLQCC